VPESTIDLTMPRPKPQRRKLPRTAVAAPMPTQFEPMLPTLVHKPFSGQEWLFEPKWDGWRATCFIKEGEARFVSRKHNSLNERFPQLNHVIACVNSRILAQLGLGAALLTAIVDTGENILTIFIAYNAERALGYDISGLLIFFFMLTSFKWVGAASALVLFACALPRSNWLERTVVLIGLIFAIVAVLGLSWPGLGLVKAVLLWMAMPFFALLFWQYRRSDPPNPIPRS
jgi:hypothetical protein